MSSLCEVPPPVLGTPVDLEILAAYDALQIEGEFDLVIELIDLYRVEAPRFVTRMRAALDQKDWLAAKRQAHGLRGSSATLGALSIVLICEMIEDLQGEVEESLAALLTCLEQELERAMQSLDAERERRLSCES
jgi:HPt (histidine-containing phosphotransfer) domain-containing protein